MNKENFDKIITKLDSLIQQCEKCIIFSQTEFNNLKVDELRTRIELAREVKSNMDKILQTELYHVIGMGNLSAVQEVQFCAKVREYGAYRPYIQSICTYNLPVTPLIPSKTDYNCKVLDINLNKQL